MLETGHEISGIASQKNANLNISIVRAYSTLSTPIPRPPYPYARLAVGTESLS